MIDTADLQKIQDYLESDKFQDQDRALLTTDAPFTVFIRILLEE